MYNTKLEERKVGCLIFGNEPKFLDKQVWANIVDLDQTAPEGLIRICTVCHSIYNLYKLFYDKTTLSIFSDDPKF